jgi:hypothetical protein
MWLVAVPVNLIRGHFPLWMLTLVLIGQGNLVSHTCAHTSLRAHSIAGGKLRFIYLFISATLSMTRDLNDMD